MKYVLDSGVAFKVMVREANSALSSRSSHPALEEHSMHWLRTTAFLTLLSLFLTWMPAIAQNEISVPAVPDTVLDFLVPVTAPPTFCAAVSDASGWLALGHRPGAGPAQLSLFRLDAQGKPAATPVAVTLPKPPALGNQANHPLSLAFHPKLPLLYVWQDFQVEKPNENLEQPGLKEFDHLLIYQLGDAPQLLQGVCRGTSYGHGNVAGSIALNPAATRLYVPNVRPSLKSPTNGGVGYLELDAAGLPIRPAATEGKPDLAPELRKQTPLAAYFGFPIGLGFQQVSDNIVIVGYGMGSATWDMGNRRAWCSQVLPGTTYGSGVNYRSAGHPTLPFVFYSTVGYGWVCRTEHADGYPTLAPKRAHLDGATLYSYPIVMARRNQFAVGGANQVYLVGFDEKGVFKPPRLQAVVASPRVDALVYSEKFDRLYVPVEKAK